LGEISFHELHGIQGGETPGGNAGLSRTTSTQLKKNQMFFDRILDREIVTRLSDARFSN
jgi:hypothetical protein